MWTGWVVNVSRDTTVLHQNVRHVFPLILGETQETNPRSMEWFKFMLNLRTENKTMLVCKIIHDNIVELNSKCIQCKIVLYRVMQLCAEAHLCSHCPCIVDPADRHDWNSECDCISVFFTTAGIGNEMCYFGYYFFPYTSSHVMY
jgi:hypothetical protein